MFTPSIYITHKILRQIVDLELSDYQYITEYKHFIPKYKNQYLIGLISSFQRKYSKTIYSESSINDVLENKKDITELRSLRNAIQAVQAFETSLRAEDDWYLMARINSLVNKQNLTVQTTNFRNKKPKNEKPLFTLHEFGNNDQMQHFILELLRWYRTSDKEINKIIRFLTLLYHLFKISPFEESNIETILITATFYIRENNLDLLHTINLPEFILTLNEPKSELNEFIGESLDFLTSNKNKLFYKLEKLNIEKTAPKKILNLNRRQIELLKIMQAKDRISRREAAEILEVSFMTAYRDIKSLLKKKLLIEQGVGRGTYYVLASK